MDLSADQFLFFSFWVIPPLLWIMSPVPSKMQKVQETLGLTSDTHNENQNTAPLLTLYMAMEQGKMFPHLETRKKTAPMSQVVGKIS